MSSFAAYASVLLDIAIDTPLDYGLSNEQLPKALRGVYVEVPVRGKLQKGYILEVKETTPFPAVKPVSRFLSDTPLISTDLFELALWISRYYCTPLQGILRFLLPPGIRKGMTHKEQLFVMRAKTREELTDVCIALRTKRPSQANVLDVMLKVKKGILLSELLEETKGSRSSVDSLVKQGLLIVEPVRIDRSP